MKVADEMVMRVVLICNCLLRCPHATMEDGSFNRTFPWRWGADRVTKRLGWPGCSVEPQATVCVVDAGLPSADDPNRGRTSQARITRRPRRLGRFGSGLRSTVEAGAQRIAAALGAGPLEG